jgi:hypothetical protein
VETPLADLKVLQNGEGQEIKWEFLPKLNEILSERCPCWHQASNLSYWMAKAKDVLLATQTLSRNVADSLRFCRTELALPRKWSHQGMHQVWISHKLWPTVVYNRVAVPDLNKFELLDPDLHSKCGFRSGSRRAKNPQK